MIPLPASIPPRYARLALLAERDPQRAVLLACRIYTRISSTDTVAFAWSSYILGWSLLRWERLQDAPVFLQQAEALFTAQGKIIPGLDARLGTLIAATLHGTKLDLFREWEDLAGIYKQQDHSLGAARAHLYQCGLLNMYGRPRDALTLAQTIYPIVFQEGTPNDKGRLLLIMATAYGECSELDQALTAVDQALEYFTDAKQPIDAGRVWMERSWLLQRREDFATALTDIERAQAIFVQYDMPMRLAFCDEHIGLLASRLGRYDQALRATLRAHKIFASSKRADLVANCDMHLGIVAYYCGLFDLALIAYVHAQQTYEQLGINRLSYVCQRNIALVLRAQGLSAQALARLQAIVPSVELLGDRLELAEIMYTQAQILCDLHEDDSALALFQQAQIMFTEHGIAGAAAECLLEQGWLYLSRSQITTAISCLEAAASALVDRPGHHWRIDYGLGRCALLQNQPHLALSYYRSASATIAKLRRLLSEHASSAIFVQAHQLFNDALDLAAECDDPQVVLEFAEQQRAITLQQQMLNSNAQMRTHLFAKQFGRVDEAVATYSDNVISRQTLEAYLSNFLQHHYLVPPPNISSELPLDLEALRRSLDAAYPTGWAGLVYVPCNQRLLIVFIDSQQLELFTISMDHKLRHLIDQACLPRYRQYTYRNISRLTTSETMPWANLAALADYLLPTAIRNRLHPDLRLLVVAGGSLHALPWSALRVADSWLTECAVIQLLPSLTLWPSLVERTTPGTDALLIGSSDFGTRAPTLHNAIPMLDLVQHLWHGEITRLENDMASRQVLLDLAASGDLRRYAHILFATHGQFVAGGGLLAHLMLNDDDLLYDEITGLNLEGALVVLATCDGAASEVLPGEEVLGLSRAFLAAGARDVIASLWQVYDQSVLIMLTSFYQALAEGHDTAQALTSAQRKLISEGRIHSENERNAVMFSPLIWASFCAIGAGTIPIVSAGAVSPADVYHDQPNSG